MINFFHQALIRALRRILYAKTRVMICVLSLLFVFSVDIGYGLLLAALFAAAAEFVKYLISTPAVEIERKLKELWR